jgi:hypothetical protein
MKTLPILLIAFAFVFAWTSFAQTQPPNSNSFQPYTPPVVGGLPPNAKNLEQPVFVADRGTGSMPPEVSDYSMPSAEDMGFDESSVVPAIQDMAIFQPGTLIAVVGEEPITIGDLVSPEKVTPEILANPQFEMMLRKWIVETIDRKAMAQRFVNDKVSGKPLKERAQARKQIELQTTKIFYQKVVPAQKEKMNCVSDLELEEKLAAMGKSLWSLKREFSESTWAGEHMRESVQEKPLVELSEMQDYYNDNLESFKRPAKARYQIMSAVFTKYPSREAAYQAIVEMWNDVFVGGAPFDAVAKRKSTGFHASEGGLFDWTTQAALKSKVIDKALFENPVRGLSQILEDSDGFHFIEVLERKNAAVQSFQDSQVEIRKTLADAKAKKQKTDFIKKVRETTPVWTKWPSDIPGSKDLTEYLQ